MIVLVCGGRDYADRARLFAFLDQQHAAEPFTLVVHGAAQGADSMAGEWAAARNVPCTPVPADWKRFGRGAGPRRNREMLARHRPDLVIAFPGGRGTADMVECATAAGVRVVHAATEEDA